MDLLLYLNLQGYVSCAFGVENVGYVLMVYGACDAFCSFSFGFIIKKVGRVPIFLFGALINVICVVVFFTWSPNPEQAYLFYVLAGLWGVADAVWQTQINGEAGEKSTSLSLRRKEEKLGYLLRGLSPGIVKKGEKWPRISISKGGRVARIFSFSPLPLMPFCCWNFSFLAVCYFDASGKWAPATEVECPRGQFS